MSNAISSQGTTIKRNSVLIGELRDVTPPALTRNTFETTTQNDGEDSYIVGIRRKGDLTFNINYLPSGDATHGNVSGLLKAYTSGSKDLYEIAYPDGSKWLFSGFLTSLAPKSPVDGVQSADVTIKPTNAMIFTP